MACEPRQPEPSRRLLLAPADPEPPRPQGIMDPAMFLLEVKAVLPLAPASADDLLALAARARWSAHHPIIDTIRDAAAARRLVPPAELGAVAAGESAAPHSGRGITGRHGDFTLSLGSAPWTIEQGVRLPDSANTALADHAAAGWTSLVLAAFHRDRRSALGLFAVGLPGETAAPGSRAALPERPAQPDAVKRPSLLARWRSHPWLLTIGLAIASAVGGLYGSALVVPEGQVAIVRRFGRTVAVCEPGLHWRSLWPVERITLTSAARTESVDLRLPLLTPEGLSEVEAGSVRYTFTDPVAANLAHRDPALLIRVSAHRLLAAALAQLRRTGSAELDAAAVRSWVIPRLQEELDIAQSGLAVADLLIADLDTLLPQDSPAAASASAGSGEPATVAAPSALASTAQPAAPAEVRVADPRQSQLRAELEASRILTAARAQAARLRAEASRDMRLQIERARAQVEDFLLTAAQYRDDPEGFRRRSLLDLFARRLPRMNKLIVDPRADAPPELLRRLHALPDPAAAPASQPVQLHAEGRP